MSASAVSRIKAKAKAETERYIQKQEVALVIVIIVAVFLTYLPTIAPTISWQNGGSDSGDFAAAVATLGIPHPPGYPTYILLGWVWTSLPLGGDLAYRLNLLSAAGATLTAGLSAITISLLGKKQTALNGWAVLAGMTVGGLTIAFAPITWTQATVTEVYAPGLAMISLFTLLIFLWQNKANSWLLVLAGAISGLGFGMIPQFILVIPGVALFLYFNNPTSWQTLLKQRLLPFAGGSTVGLTVFAYLPWRAVAHPIANWGKPDNLSRFWQVVTAAQYQYLIDRTDQNEWINRLLESMTILGQQLSWAGLILAFLGGYALWRSDKTTVGYIVSLVILTLMFRASYQVTNNRVYLLPAIYGGALLAGVGTTWLLITARENIGDVGITLLGLALIFAVIWRAVGISPLVNISDDRTADLFGQKTLSELPQNALIISEQDRTTFSLWYRQSLGDRPDVMVVDKRLLLHGWYLQNLKYRYPDMDTGAVKLNGITVLKRPAYTIAGTEGKEVIKPVISQKD